MYNHLIIKLAYFVILFLTEKNSNFVVIYVTESLYCVLFTAMQHQLPRLWSIACRCSFVVPSPFWPRRNLKVRPCAIATCSLLLIHSIFCVWNPPADVNCQRCSSSVMAIVTCLIGLHFGHIIVHFKVINYIKNK